MGARKTVLVVDDSQAVRDVLESALDEAGFAVASASSGEEVFRKLTQAQPAALLLDLYMPGLNGADVCRLVKSHPQWKDVYLVLMSSRIGEDADAYRRLGADEILKKPIDPAGAVALVRRALDRGGAAG